MTIVEALKQTNVRISNGGRWLTWDEASREWVVRDQPYRAQAREVGRAEDESKAVALLLGDGEEPQ